MAVEPQEFKNALAQWASGVTILTSADGDQRVGITASSLTSVSLEPPRILVCVGRRLYTHEVIERSRVFAVNILGEDHLEWGMRFAGMLSEFEDRFAGLHCTTAVTGAPILPESLAWIDCRLVHAHDEGDHTIFVGEVEATGVQEAKAPLLYYSRQWRRLDEERLRLP